MAHSLNFVDISGQRFGKLVALTYAGYSKGSSRWICQCDCGSQKPIAGTPLRRGRIRSCGCDTRRLISEAIVKHGDARGGRVSREHAIWRGIVTRCTNRNRAQWADYGGRGITLCDRWRDFAKFLTDMGRAPSAKHSIDRIDNDKGYEPNNCRWADAATQAKNRRKRSK